MRVVDPGHRYELTQLDLPEHATYSCTELWFVKRVGEKYPGNTNPHPGTTVQEVLRACIDRLTYVYNQIPDQQTKDAAHSIKCALYALELRAARRHGREPEFTFSDILEKQTCPKCNHIGCHGECHK